jgi:hypothetical protein
VSAGVAGEAVLGSPACWAEAAATMRATNRINEAADFAAMIFFDGMNSSDDTTVRRAK